MEVGDESEDEEDMDDQDQGVESIDDDVIENVADVEPSTASEQAVIDTLPVPSRVRIDFLNL